jgi:glycosyltransferase involved in cell wall biosynthesis
MRKVKYFISLLDVLARRAILLMRSAANSLKLGLPLRYSLFPLLPQLSWGQIPGKSVPDHCDTQLAKSVDVVISLYKFEKYQSVIEKSLESCLQNPLVTFHIILVSGSSNEIAWAENFFRGSHHKIHLSETRIGIYEAWNLGIQNGSADFITNLNADDLRLPHSICQQAADLQQRDVDGSYANFALSSNIFDSLNSRENRHLVSNLGTFEIDTLIKKSENFMHCAPMWKRELHTRVGYFDSSLTSSGDTQFWLRCLVSGASFGLYPPVTAIYFHNPEGLSTSVSSAGSKEWGNIRREYLMNKAEV